MKKVILVLSLLLVAGSSQCMSSLSSLTASFSKALQKGAQSLLTQGKDVITKQSNVLLDQAKKQVGTLVDQSKTVLNQAVEQTKQAAIDKATALKNQVTQEASGMAKLVAADLTKKGTALAMDTKNKLVEQAKAALSKNPVGNQILAFLSYADKLKLESLTPTEQAQFIQDAVMVADTTAQTLVQDTNQIENATVQAVQTVGRQAERDIQMSIDAKRAVVKQNIYDLYGKGTPNQ